VIGPGIIDINKYQLLMKDRGDIAVVLIAEVLIAGIQ
jgi:hypothetical protein